MAIRHNVSTSCRAIARVQGGVLAILLCMASASFAASAATRADRVVDAMLATYVHGVTPELATELVGPAGVPTLVALLRDPAFPRRDNVVAFLAHVGGAESAGELLAFLASPVEPSVPEEDRSLLLAPQALGHLARRGHDEALTALLDLTASDADGGPLGTAAARGRDARALRRDLLRMALRGLALSGTPAARTRLRALAEGRARPPRDFDDAAVAAASALRLMAGLEGEPSAATAPEAHPRNADTQPNTHDSGLTYANHPDVGSPMDDARLDAVLGLASLRTGRADFGADVSCCALVTRSGSALTFGTAGDGLDVIDDEPELLAVLGDATARTKVVRAINHCGGPGMNIIGCAETPGNSMTVVRRTSLGSEAVLWMHEYGHNTGLGHHASSRHIMFGINDGSNDGVSQSECDAFHSPAPAAGIIPTNVGACADTDLDEVHDLIDNCPTVPNFDQADADQDGVGDPCETICGDHVTEGPEECDDGNLDPGDGCTDACTICGNAVITPPEECDDGNLVNDDGCSASCLLACPPAPAGGCIVPTEPRKASLLLKKKPLPSGDQIVWKWVKGPVTPKADFGTPTTSTGYLLCVYDGAGLVLDANAPAGGLCAGKPCWSERATSFAYRDKELTPDGLQQLVLKQGLLAGKASIQVKGRGGLLAMPDPGGLLPPLRVQLRRSGASACWEAVFSAPFTKQDSTQLRDKAD